MKEHREYEVELRVPENMCEVHEAVERPSEQVYDVLEERREKEVELQVPENMFGVDEDIVTFNCNDDDKEDSKNV